MSRTNKLRNQIQKKKIEDQEDAKQYIQDGFLNSIQKLMFDFQQRVDKGDINIDNPNDLYKLFVIFDNLNRSNNIEGGGALPQLSTTQNKVFEDISNDEGDLDLTKLEEMSAEDLSQLIAEKEQQMNDDNARF